ncbi:hypothetical protein NDU88_006333 [Pleurodeles waltl]|uniref:Uncharacterized protein n=1 Tax=Pleurodeles waltl TaxID=8319 RepID=A0AAV7PR19_PLEWA|nr:hypothetical protein NDU88_006333 [Pleurodeles waltl]
MFSHNKEVAVNPLRERGKIHGVPLFKLDAQEEGDERTSVKREDFFSLTEAEGSEKQEMLHLHATQKSHRSCPARTTEKKWKEMTTSEEEAQRKRREENIQVQCPATSQERRGLVKCVHDSWDSGERRGGEKQYEKSAVKKMGEEHYAKLS